MKTKHIFITSNFYSYSNSLNVYRGSNKPIDQSNLRYYQLTITIRMTGASTIHLKFCFLKEYVAQHLQGEHNSQCTYNFFLRLCSILCFWYHYYIEREVFGLKI